MEIKSWRAVLLIDLLPPFSFFFFFLFFGFASNAHCQCFNTSSIHASTLFIAILDISYNTLAQIDCVRHVNSLNKQLPDSVYRLAVSILPSPIKGIIIWSAQWNFFGSIYKPLWYFTWWTECFWIIHLRSSVKVGGFQYLLKFSLISPHGCSLKENCARLQQISVWLRCIELQWCISSCLPYFSKRDNS